MRKETHSSSVNALAKRISAPTAAATVKPSQTITADVIGLLGLYGKAKAINPDSLTLKDSLLIREIDKDLKNILHEKD